MGAAFGVGRRVHPAPLRDGTPARGPVGSLSDAHAALQLLQLPVPTVAPSGKRILFSPPVSLFFTLPHLPRPFTRPPVGVELVFWFGDGQRLRASFDSSGVAVVQVHTSSTLMYQCVGPSCLSSPVASCVLTAVFPPELKPSLGHSLLLRAPTVGYMTGDPSAHRCVMLRGVELQCVPLHGSSAADSARAGAFVVTALVHTVSGLWNSSAETGSSATAVVPSVRISNVDPEPPLPPPDEQEQTDLLLTLSAEDPVPLAAARGGPVISPTTPGDGVAFEGLGQVPDTTALPSLPPPSPAVVTAYQAAEAAGVDSGAGSGTAGTARAGAGAGAGTGVGSIDTGSLQQGSIGTDSEAATAQVAAPVSSAAAGAGSALSISSAARWRHRHPTIPAPPSPHSRNPFVLVLVTGVWRADKVSQQVASPLPYACRVRARLVYSRIGPVAAAAAGSSVVVGVGAGIGAGGGASAPVSVSYGAGGAGQLRAGAGGTGPTGASAAGPTSNGVGVPAHVIVGAESDAVGGDFTFASAVPGPCEFLRSAWSDAVVTGAHGSGPVIASESFAYRVSTNTCAFPFFRRPTVDRVSPCTLTIDGLSVGSKRFDIRRVVSAVAAASSTLNSRGVVPMPDQSDDGTLIPPLGELQRLVHRDAKVCEDWVSLILTVAALLLPPDSAAHVTALACLNSIATRRAPSHHPELAWLFDQASGEAAAGPALPSAPTVHIGAAPAAAGALHPSSAAAKYAEGSECTICFEKPVSAVYVPCGHSACFECATIWSTSKHLCHSCRAPITNVMRVYL